MTINSDLMFAILSMDSYNRGYSPGLGNLIGDTIGDVTIVMDSQIYGQDGKDAGFYAVAYKWNDQTIISYRGTDQIDVEAGGDILNGWLQGGGYFTSQAGLAFRFYQEVAQEVAPGIDWRNVKIATTGHSLGGGLAGLVAATYGKKAKIFDNMPYEFAAENAHDLSQLDTMLGFSTLLYGSAEPWSPSIAGIDGYAFEGEVLSNLRHLQIRQPFQLSDLGGGVRGHSGRRECDWQRRSPHDAAAGHSAVWQKSVGRDGP